MTPAFLTQNYLKVSCCVCHYLWHHSVVLLLVLPAGWPTELDYVEIYKCSQEVQETSSRHQHRKQVG